MSNQPSNITPSNQHSDIQAAKADAKARIDEVTKSNSQASANDNSSKSTKKYYKSNVSALTVVLKAGDPASPGSDVVERFTPYVEIYQGDKIKKGYHATSNKKFIDRVKNDGNVIEISEKEYKEATGKDSVKASL